MCENMTIKILIFAFSSWVLQFSEAADKLVMEKEILERLMNDGRHISYVRPPGPNGTDEPVIIRTNMYIRHIGEIDDVNMDYKIQLTFRQQWRDNRLAYEGKNLGDIEYVSLLDKSSIWTPDVFFSNERDGRFHNIISPNTLIRIYPTGDVFFSIRISLRLTCPMDLRNYPLDRQTCSIIMASYGYTTEDIVFLWKESNPVQMLKSLHLLTFSLSAFETKYCTSRTSTGEYSCLKVDLTFDRVLTYYFYYVYMPFALMVILSWIPFWLDSRETVARVVIWVGILLGMTITSSSVQAKLPAMSVTKAIDVWMGVCWTFLFAVIVEFVVISQTGSHEEKNPLTVIDCDAENNPHKDSKLGKVGKWLNKYPTRVKRIDVISRVCFPLAFIIFNIIYWASYGRSY